MKSLDREPPYIVFASLVGVDGAKYAPPDREWDYEIGAFDRDTVLVSDNLLEVIPGTDEELLEKPGPLFNEMANAAGWTQSPIGT